MKTGDEVIWIQKEQIIRCLTGDWRRMPVFNWQPTDYAANTERAACRARAFDRSNVRYNPIRLDDVDLRAAMKGVAVEQCRFRYRRIHVMLDRQGTEFTSTEILSLSQRTSVGWHCIAPRWPAAARLRTAKRGQANSERLHRELQRRVRFLLATK
jgi:hypothetical protein